MKKLISLTFIIILFIVVSVCILSEKTRTPGKIHSQKTIRLQENISDYSATVEEKLQNGGPTIRREILIKRPYQYRIKDARNCYSLSNGTVLWSYCNASDNLRAFSDPSVRDFIADVDYQQIFSSMLGASPATLMGNETIDGTGTWILETTPPRSSAYHMRYDYNSVRLWVDEETGMILRAEMIPKNASDIGIIRFSNITINSGISDEAFILFPTAGIPVSSQPAQGLYAAGLDKAAGYTGAAKPCTDCPLPTTTPLPESLGPGQQQILNESLNNSVIWTSRNSRLLVRLTDWSKTGGKWSLTASDGLLLSDEGTVWYDEKGIPTNIPGLGKGFHTWNVVMNGSGTQTIDATLTYLGRGSTDQAQKYQYTIIIAP
jgi:outer membrane lipoprotein-sorting protein/predicted secreted protein